MSDIRDEVLREDGTVITARGTEEGLVLRIDGRAQWNSIVGEMNSFLGDRRRFLEGGEVAIEWLDRLPTKDQSQQLEDLLREDYGIEIVGRKRKQPKLISDRSKEMPAPERVEKTNLTRYDIYGKDDDLEVDSFQGAKLSDILGDEGFYEEEANARAVFGTLRSGQRIETPFSLMVVGDVNPGADLVAGGDIIVFGSLRGTAHAAAYDDEARDRVIIAMQMQPMQLRIGSVISRGNGDAARGAEIARIEERRIIVEQFNPRAFGNRFNR